jgi:hypothetical protein
VDVVKLPVDLACWLIKLVEDPQSTVEATLTRIQIYRLFMIGNVVTLDSKTLKGIIWICMVEEYTHFCI